jgi:hypothetical protein
MAWIDVQDNQIFASLIFGLAVQIHGRIDEQHVRADGDAYRLTESGLKRARTEKLVRRRTNLSAATRTVLVRPSFNRSALADYGLRRQDFPSSIDTVGPQSGSCGRSAELALNASAIV